MDVEQALIKLEEMVSGWNISPQEWVLGPVWALRLQGYDVRVFMNRIDTNILIDKLPWELRKEVHSVSDIHENLRRVYDFATKRFTIPSQNYKEMEDYIEFMQSTGYTLYIHPLESNFIPKSKVEYTLPNSRLIYLMTIRDAVGVVASLVPVMKLRGEEAWMRDHLAFFQEVKGIAESKEDTHIVRICEEALANYPAQSYPQQTTTFNNLLENG